MTATKTKFLTLFASCLYALTSGFPVLADDIDIFIGGGGTAASAKKNVLLLIDTSGSMQKAPKCTGNNCETTPKYEIVRNVLNEIFTGERALTPSASATANPLFKNINFAMIRFKPKDGNQSSNDGGNFVLPFTPLTDDNLDSFTSEVANINAEGNTPLAETLYETTRFYLGLGPKYNNNMLSGLTASTTDPSDNTITTKYTPDFSGECGVENHLVILTDGKPTSDSDADSLIAEQSDETPDGTLPGYSSKHGIAVCSSDSKTRDPDTDNFYTGNDCLPLLSEYLYKHDFDNNPDNGTQNVITHTIAFDLNAQSGIANRLLDQTATYCDDYYPAADAYEYITNKTKPSRKCRGYSAKNSMDLANAFTSILTSVNKSTTTFTNAAVPISSELYHENEAFFALFKPAMTPRWKGNLKGYQILDTTEPGKIGKDYFDHDSPAKPVLDGNGNIKDDVISKWGKMVDGGEIELSGAESQIPSVRNVFTYTGNNSNYGASNPTPLNLDTLNTSLDAALFGVTTNAERDDIVHWALGEAPYENRHIIGDPLHSQPVIIKYKDPNDNEIPFAFFGTNDGFLHAVNLITGQEAFAFIPKELLPNLKTYLSNAEMSQLIRPYGLDGEITVGKIDDKIMLFFGMRRGGSNYYSLDITNVYDPKFIWQINGGPDGTVDYEELGQTWSKPLFAKVNFEDANNKIALIFSGGYDETDDDPNHLGGSTVGRAVYIVDATNGQRLWWAHGGSGDTRTADELVLSEMTNSIPSSIAALDVNGDDAVDRMYFIDIAGQLFRIDLDGTLETTDALGNRSFTSVPDGGIIANLRGTDPADQRRFYNEPEIVLSKLGSYHFARINVGSGYRANPLGNSIQNRIYSIRDENISSYTGTYTLIGENELSDATNLSMSHIEADSKGWFFDLPGTGEKALSQTMTLNNHLMFTTYTPPQGTGNNCSPPAGTATFYMVSLFDGYKQRVHTLDRGGIPPAPMPLIFDRYDENGKHLNPELAIAVGMEFIKDDYIIPPGDPEPLPALGLEPVLNKNFWEEL